MLIYTGYGGEEGKAYLTYMSVNKVFGQWKNAMLGTSMVMPSFGSGCDRPTLIAKIHIRSNWAWNRHQ